MDRRFDCVLMDGTNLAHRAWHAGGQNASDASGMLTAMVRNAVEAHKPRHASFALDDRDCFRRELYPDYKAGRAEKSPELREWLDLLLDLAAIGGVSVVTAKEHEADDVVATHCREYLGALRPHHAIAKGCLILTSDLDAYALVGEFVTVGKPALYSRGPYYSAKDVWDKYGVWPNQVAAYKAMAGDHSDNVHGVPGVGPVAARRFLSQAPGLPVTAFDLITSPPARCTPSEAKQRALICHAVTLLRHDAPVSRRLADCPVGVGLPA